MGISVETLKLIMPGTKHPGYIDYLNAAMDEFQINTVARQAAFLAQIAHESGQFRWLEELWGPTQDQKEYEPPHKKASALGNTEKGDGLRYKGRGVIQITGRANYRAAGDFLKVDFENNPELAGKPEYAFRIAGWFWNDRNLNRLADIPTRSNFQLITKKINGGLTGWSDRWAFYKRALRVFGFKKFTDGTVISEE